MVKEMVMLVRRVNCFEVVRIKKVQFFAKKGGSENIFTGNPRFPRVPSSSLMPRMWWIVFFRKGIEKVIRVIFLKDFERRFSIKCKNK